MVGRKIVKILQKTIGVKDIVLDVPTREEFGDYSTNVAMVLAKKEGKDPERLAGEFKEKIWADKNIKTLCAKVKVVSPGFINFYLNKDLLFDNLIQIGKQKENYGRGGLLKGQKIMFEFAHPNTHKAFHIGHLRNITTGEALARLSEFVGADVIRVNYQGDIGLHIAKVIFGIKKIGFSDPGEIKARAKYLGEAYVEGAAAFEKSEEAKKRIGKINEMIYSKEDKDINRLYETTRGWSLAYFDCIYGRVYTKFDRFYFESEVAEAGKEMALGALEQGILETSEGAVIFPGKKYGLHDRVFISGKGVPTYEAKDLGLAKLQFAEYNPEKILHVVGPEQSDYFKVIFKALELIVPISAGREFHLPYGWVRLKDGKMSSRTGKIVLGEWLLDEVKKSVIDVYKTDKETAETIAVGAVKYFFLRNGLNQDIVFDVGESISLEGNSGPYLQYTVARINSVLAKAEHGLTPKASHMNPEESTILRALIHFPKTVESAALNFSPNFLCTYLFGLAQKFNTFYNTHGILEERTKDKEQSEFRLALTAAVGVILENGLKLLGINTPERM